MRVCQLQRRDKNLEKTTLHLRLERKERYHLKHGICEKKLAIGSIVLLYNTRRKKDMSRKFAFKWLGPYQIFHAVRDKGTAQIHMDLHLSSYTVAHMRSSLRSQELSSEPLV